MITADQAYLAGITPAALRGILSRGEWHRVGRGVYRIGTPPAPWEANALAGTFLGGSGSMVMGEAAAFLWELTRDAPDSIEILIPESRKTPDSAPWKFVRSRRLPKPYGTPPRTPLADTVLDLCQQDPASITKWIDAALRRPGVSAKAILAAMDLRHRVPGREIIAGIISDHLEGVHTELERAYRANVERAHGLPEGTRQVRRGNRRHDLEYLERLIVELDGRLGHAGFARFRDMHRDNENLVLGLLTLRYGWFDSTEKPCEVARQVATMLWRLGWTGTLRTCPRCRTMSAVA
ncbi:MAG TPA: hypothetical protein GX743_07025 [Actinomycetales bacterium]|nr:hypothetical protein [Actinomycetales bacterium]